MGPHASRGTWHGIASCGIEDGRHQPGSIRCSLGDCGEGRRARRRPRLRRVRGHAAGVADTAAGDGRSAAHRERGAPGGSKGSVCDSGAPSRGAHSAGARRVSRRPRRRATALGTRHPGRASQLRELGTPSAREDRAVRHARHGSRGAGLGARRSPGRRVDGWAARVDRGLQGARPGVRARGPRGARARGVRGCARDADPGDASGRSHGTDLPRSLRVRGRGQGSADRSHDDSRASRASVQPRGGHRGAPTFVRSRDGPRRHRRGVDAAPRPRRVPRRPCEPGGRRGHGRGGDRGRLPSRARAGPAHGVVRLAGGDRRPAPARGRARGTSRPTASAAAIPRQDALP